jgi:hypothetical protein
MKHFIKILNESDADKKFQKLFTVKCEFTYKRLAVLQVVVYLF